MAARGAVPIPLSREIDPDALCRENPCDSLHILGSFWPYSHNSIESRAVKVFKECRPICEFDPHISELCEFYAQRVLEAVGAETFGWIARVLSSSEADYDATRPQSLLVDTLIKRCGARGAQSVFFKSGPRPPMRTVSHLSGPEALRTRIRYAAQDLFVRPMEMGGSVLLIDDIMNTGASMRVYANALKQYAGAERVVGVNLAVTRFNRGRDGRGKLIIDLSALESRPGMGMVWLDESQAFHLRRECLAAEGVVSVEMRFMAERKGRPCPACREAPKTKRKWWQVWTKEVGSR